MKRKIISILLILIILTMSLPIINAPVKAKVLEDWEDWWIYENDSWIGENDPESIIEYDTVDEYLNAHYKDYASTDKSQITRLFIDCCYGSYVIKDLSGLHDFQNLTELAIYSPNESIKTLDLTRIANLKKLDLVGIDVANIDFSKLPQLTYLNIEYYESWNDFTIDLSQMNNLKHFWFMYYGDLYDDREHTEIINDFTNRILPPTGYETFSIVHDTGNVCGFSVRIGEKLNVNITTDKTSYNLGDKVTTTVNWDKGIQATDFEINFDSSKLKLESSSIDDDYYKLVEPGRILVSWASFEEIDIQEIEFEFSAIGDGQAEIVVLPENFADGNLDTDFIFAEAKQVITIEKSGYVKPNKEITTTVIDNKETITGLNVTNNQLKIEDFLAEDNFADNLEVKVFNSSNEEITDTSKGLGTGSKVKLYENGNVVKEYIVIVYGDTTGDGQIRANDALTLIKAANQIIPFQTETHKEAARVMSGSGKEPNARDALAIVKSANYSYTINQSK